MEENNYDLTMKSRRDTLNMRQSLTYNKITLTIRRKEEHGF